MCVLRLASCMATFNTPWCCVSRFLTFSIAVGWCLPPSGGAIHGCLPIVQMRMHASVWCGACERMKAALTCGSDPFCMHNAAPPRLTAGYCSSAAAGHDPKCQANKRTCTVAAGADMRRLDTLSLPQPSWMSGWFSGCIFHRAAMPLYSEASTTEGRTQHCQSCPIPPLVLYLSKRPQRGTPLATSFCKEGQRCTATE